MGKTLEARLAVVSALAAIPHAAKGERMQGAVDEGVVHAGAAGADFVEDAGGFAGGAEGVEAQWGGVDCVCGCDGGGEGWDGEDGDEGAEGFGG